jgi:FkbM family methyltransferase
MTVDQSARGSDVPRSYRQLLKRKIAESVVAVLGLNRPGELSTEIVQAIHPVASVPTAYGPLFCKGGHGRLTWRVKTFFEEEPGTVAWLDRLGPEDVYWDVGANVGLYAIYAAKFKGCRTFAFEPESQNFALLVENMVLNGVDGRCTPMCIAINEESKLGRLRVRYITKGGAYNMYHGGLEGDVGEAPPTMQQIRDKTPNAGFDQGIFGFSIDDLVTRHGLPSPTHLKIDVDNIEAMIVRGGINVIRGDRLRGVVIELNTQSADDMATVALLQDHGFKLTSRTNNQNAGDVSAMTMIFERG